MKSLPFVLALLLGSPSWAQSAIDHESRYDQAATLFRLKVEIATRGATLFAEIDHAAGAASVDVAMPAMTVLIFGNPKIGTPLIAANPLAGLDLPLKLLVYADPAGKTHIAYRDPENLCITDESHDQCARIAAVLDAIATAAGQ